MTEDVTTVTYVSEDSLVDLSYLDDDELNDELAGTLSEMSDKDDSFLVSDEDIFGEGDQEQDCNKPKYSSFVTKLFYSSFLHRISKEDSLDSAASMEVTIQKVMDQWEIFRIQRRKERRLREKWKCFYLGKHFSIEN